MRTIVAFALAHAAGEEVRGRGQRDAYEGIRVSMKPVRMEPVLGMTTMTNEEFADRVYLWLTDDADNKRAYALADHFEAMRSTPGRWAKGTARPHPRIQAQIIRYIEEHP